MQRSNRCFCVQFGVHMKFPFCFRVKTAGLALVFLSGSSSLLCAQSQGIPSFQSPNRVEAEPISPVTVIQGHQAPMEFRFRVRQGFHINSHQPSSEELKPTELHFSLPTGIIIGQLQYPAGTLTSFPFDPVNKISVYSGEVIIKAMAMSEAGEMTGPYNVHGELTYQACDDRSCYPPKKLPIEFVVNVGRTPHRRR